MSNIGTILTILVLAVGFFALAMIGLGIGKLFNRKGITGGCCSTTDFRDARGDRLTCGSCKCEDRDEKHAANPTSLRALDSE